MPKLKKILKIIAGIFVVLLFVASVISVIASITQKQTGVPGAFGFSFAVVQTNSMADTIHVGDIAVGKLLKADTVINVNDIVTYKTVINNQAVTITHRVTDVIDGGTQTFYETWGDNRTYDYEGEQGVCYAPDEGYRAREDIVSVYVGKISGFGKFINFLREPIGFILCLVLPLVLFVAYEVFSLIRIYMNAKKAEMVEQAKDNTSDEVREAIIREYLAKQKQEEGSDNKSGDDLNEGTDDHK